jgi:hypothetical protein
MLSVSYPAVSVLLLLPLLMKVSSPIGSLDLRCKWRNDSENLEEYLMLKKAVHTEK